MRITARRESTSILMALGAVPAEGKRKTGLSRPSSSGVWPQGTSIVSTRTDAPAARVPFARTRTAICSAVAITTEP
jgi:hypothetical protein